MESLQGEVWAAADTGTCVGILQLCTRAPETERTLWILSTCANCECEDIAIYQAFLAAFNSQLWGLFCLSTYGIGNSYFNQWVKKKRFRSAQIILQKWREKFAEQVAASRCLSEMSELCAQRPLICDIQPRIWRNRSKMQRKIAPDKITRQLLNLTTSSRCNQGYAITRLRRETWKLDRCQPSF